jgi:hypothetical protein
LQLQQAFLRTYGLIPQTKAGLPVDQLMKFVCESFASANGEVRAQATAVTVEVYRLIGTGVERYLTGLKPVVREALSSEFEKADSAAASGGSVSETVSKRRSSIGGVSEGILQGSGVPPSGGKKAAQQSRKADPPGKKAPQKSQPKKEEREHHKGSPKPHAVKKHAPVKHPVKHQSEPDGRGEEEERGHGPRPKVGTNEACRWFSRISLMHVSMWDVSGCVLRPMGCK